MRGSEVDIRILTEEAYADMTEVAWLARFHPARYDAVMQEIYRQRDDYLKLSKTDPKAAAGHLSSLLPGLVDRLSPGGALPDAERHARVAWTARHQPQPTTTCRIERTASSSPDSLRAIDTRLFSSSSSSGRSSTDRS